jgi:type II secretory pathway pseudopilin PulG
MFSDAGSSIMEMLLVMLIVAIAAGSTALSSSRLLQARRLKSTSTELLRHIEHWALEARYLQEDVHLIFGETSLTTLRMSTLSSPEAKKSLPKGIRFAEPRFANLSLGERVLTLRKNGSATPGRVTLVAKNGSRCELIHALRGRKTLRCRQT